MSNIIEKILTMSQVDLNRLRVNATNRLDDPKKYNQASEILDAIDKELERRYLPGMIETFKHDYPNGFYGDIQAEEERNYKVYACEQFQELLGKDEFSKLLKEENYNELYIRAKKIIGLTNFIQGSFEKPKLLEIIDSNASIYMEELYKFIWGTEILETRFSNFVVCLEKLGLNKWTYITYFLFLSSPSEHMFVKPEMIKKSLDISKYPLNYSATPSTELYLEIVKFSKWLKEKIRILKPRDMIDVHSFMWHMAPTGKFSRE